MHGTSALPAICGAALEGALAVIGRSLGRDSKSNPLRKSKRAIGTPRCDSPSKEKNRKTHAKKSQVCLPEMDICPPVRGTRCGLAVLNNTWL